MRPRLAPVFAALAGLVIVAAACGQGGYDSTGQAGILVTTTTIPKPVPTNADGTPVRGLFAAVCPYTHGANDDLILAFNKPGSAHRNDFFGNKSALANATPAALMKAGDGCDLPGDRSAYWTPTLFHNSQVVVPTTAIVYYRLPVGVAPNTVHAPPFGLQLISADPAATTAPPGRAGWSCGKGAVTDGLPSTCPADAPLSMHVLFPQCWDGHLVKSTDHLSHMALDVNGKCPADHPVQLPELEIVVRYPLTGTISKLFFSAGPITAVHGAAVLAWDSRLLLKSIDDCIGSSVVCQQPAA